MTIEAVKGFEYTPAKTTVQAIDGKTVQVDLELRPIDDLSARGWYNGSTHVHMNYAGNLHNTPANLMMMSAAEDQDMVNEQIANKDNRVLDHQHFVPGGKPHPISTPDRLLVVGQEYRPAFYGHVFMFQLRDHLISPFATGYEGTAIESLYPSNTDMLRKAKAQGATVGYVHAFFGDKDPLSEGLALAQRLHRRRRARHDRCARVVRRRHGGFLSLVRDAQQRAPRDGRRRRGLDQQHAHLEARRARRARTCTPGDAGSTPTPGSRACAKATRSSRRGRSSSSRSMVGFPARRSSCRPAAAR